MKKECNIKPTSIGGQAVIEGIMMRGPSEISVAVRKSNGEIVIKKEDIKNSLSNKLKINKIPIVRGFVALISSMIIGIKALTYSANLYEIDEDEDEVIRR